MRRAIWKIGVLTALLSVFFVFHASLPARADSNISPWLESGEINLKEVANNLSPEQRSNYNLDCTNETGITRKARTTPTRTTQLTLSGCAVTTSSGTFMSDHLRLSNTGLYGRLTHSTGGSFGVVPIPNSDTVYNLTNSDRFSAEVNFVENFGTLLKSQILSDGQVEHIVQPYTTMHLKDGSGSPIRINNSSVAYSKNGDWMLANSPYAGAVRINLKTFEILPFGEIFNYFGGTAPGVQAAISNDGRYAVVTSSSFYSYKIYDLSTCEAVPSKINGPVNCKYIDLYPVLISKIPGFLDLQEVRFATNHTIRFYGYVRQPSGSVGINQYLLTAPGQAMSGFEYLGLGDSFASGEGAYDYRDGTDTDNNKCHNSKISYPYLIGIALGQNTHQSVACSGAIISDVTSSVRNYSDPQARGKAYASFDQEIFEKFLPGYRPQNTFLNLRPSVVTISMGGNDIGFSNIILRCMGIDTCYSIYEERLELVRATNSQFDQLVNMYKQLKDAGSPKVYVIGYPEVAKNDGACGLNVRLDREEIKFSNLLISHLNSVIEKAAKKAGVVYVDTSRAMYGHRLCETVFSDTAINGVTAGNDKVDLWGVEGPVGNESFHPNALGHRLFKESIQRETDNFSKPMPPADSTVTSPTEDDNMEILQVPKARTKVHTTLFQDDLADDVLYRGETFDANLDDSARYIPESLVEVTLYSDPISLGTYRTDSTGGLQAAISIPGDVEPGFHTLHFRGTNVVGEPVDTYKTVYVAVSESDMDGDGMPNSAEECGYGDPSGVDEDSDGIDDACDSSFTEQPPVEPVSNDKPPENNPETVAGNEPQNPPPEPETPITNTTDSTTPPAQPRPTPSAVLSESQSQATTSQSSPTSVVFPQNKNIQTTAQNTKTTPWAVYLVVTILAVAAGFYFLITRHHK